MPVELWLECSVGAEVVRPGQDRLLVVGNCPALGSWEPSRGVPLQPSSRCLPSAPLSEDVDGDAVASTVSWQLRGGPLLLADDPDFLPWKLEYRYAVQRAGGEPGEYDWEDLGECEVPTFSGCGNIELSLPWKWAVQKVNRRLRLPCCHAVILRRDTCSVAYELPSGPALWERAWRVGADWGPGVAGCDFRLGPRCRTPWSVGEEGKEEGGSDENGKETDGMIAQKIFVQPRLSWRRAGLEQLLRHRLLPGQVWGVIGELVGGQDFRRRP